MEEIKQIVDRLNEEPFNYGLSLVTFDQKNPLELLQLLNEVFVFLSEDHRVDLREELPEATGVRMTEFLRVLKYRHSMDVNQFKGRLLSGDRAIIYPILHWLLPRVQDLKIRAYLARYLVTLDIPDEFLGDDEVNSEYNHYRSLQEEFRETHRTIEVYRQEAVNPNELRRDIQRLEREKEQLHQKVTMLKEKLKSFPEEEFEVMFAACSRLRRDQEEEDALVEREREQETMMKDVQANHRGILGKLEEMRQEQAKSGVQGVVEKLGEETSVNRFLATEKLPKEIAEKEERLRNMRSVLNEYAMSDNDLNRLRSTVRGLEDDVAVLKQKEMDKMSSGDSQIAAFRKQAQAVAKKKEAVAEELNELISQRRQLEEEVNEKNKILLNTQGSSKVLKGDDFKKYAVALRGKHASFKKLKAVLNAIQVENGVLLSTEGILSSKEEEMKGVIAQLEREKGVTGYSDAQAQLEEISAANAQVNEKKGETLNELTAVVSEITSTIKERKNKLAPLIKDLRTQRTEYSELEAKYSEAKSRYESIAAGIDSEMGKLGSEVSVIMEERAREEGRYHYMNCMTKIVGANLERCQKAHRGKSLHDVYRRHIGEQERDAKNLRERQKMLKESHTPSIQQMSMFTDLKKLMQCKMRVYNQQMQQQQEEEAASKQTGAMDYSDFQGAAYGVNRLVIQ
jgi:intraflagellar transport protein 81